MRHVIRSLLAEPRVPNPPVRVWRDWALISVLIPAAVLEAILRPDVVWRPFAFILGVGLMFTVLWRRTHPLAVVGITFGAMTVASVAGVVTGAGEVGLYSSVFVAILPYALFRWASGRDAAAGLAIIAGAAVINSVVAALEGSTSSVILEPLIGSALFLVLPAALGALVRYEVKARVGQIDQAKLREREQLARELHDTVAHHVSAIVIQAQAGYTVAGTDPDAATDALVLIEEEASRTLAEMRVMVGALREDETPDLAPQRGVADIERLARNAGEAPSINVELSGELTDLAPSLDAAIYRLAQESITNAVRHARHATRIDVSVTADDDIVHLIVRDDGDTASTGRNPAGYGLVGMSERTSLLGGTLDAGPNADNRGWTVNAVLPKSESRT